MFGCVSRVMAPPGTGPAIRFLAKGPLSNITRYFRLDLLSSSQSPLCRSLGRRCSPRLDQKARLDREATSLEYGPISKGLPAKQLELALEIVSHATKVGLLTNLQDPKALLRRRKF